MLLTVPVGLLVASCGSFQEASYYDNDGIYASSETTVAPTEQHNNVDNDTYVDYFDAKAKEYDELLNSDAIFTDVDSYNSGEYAQDSTDLIDDETYRSFAGWGDNTTDVSINIYTNPRWGWYASPWFWGWNRWNRWNFGWNWGVYNYAYAGWIDPFWIYDGWWSPYWGYNFGFYGYYGWYGRPFYYNYGYYPHSLRRSYAYANSRRGYYNRSNLTSTDSRYRYSRGRSSNYTRTRALNYTRNRGYSTNNNARYRNSRGISADGRGNIYSRSGSSNNRVIRGRSYNSNRSTPNYSRSSSRSRSSGSYNRSSSGRSRSSGSIRSSSGSRSSGTSRSSGSSRSRRNN